MLSIVVPIDANTNIFYQETIKNFQNHNDVEMIFVDQAEAFTRAERLNLGFHRSHGELILFHHPRSKLPIDAIEFLIKESEKKDPSYIWGGFFHQFDNDHCFLKLISWYSNRIRVGLKGIVYLDHCIFFSRSMWTKDLPIQYLFEDTELSLQFRKIKKPVLLPYTAVTSSHRFLKKGILRQTLLNFLLKLGYKLQLPSSFLFSLYQR